jgi:hypothetical protein
VPDRTVVAIRTYRVDGQWNGHCPASTRIATLFR